MYQDVRFYSEGAAILGHLYLPSADAGKVPGVVLCHGFAGVKEMLLPAFASFFADNGIAALTFDYRGFGASEGVSGRLVPMEQVQDIRNAITYLASLDKIDESRLGLWGTSYGGANAIVAASKDVRVKALVVQLTFGDGERVIMGNKNAEERQKMLESIDRISTKAVTTNKQMMLGVNRLLADEQSKLFYDRYVKEFDALKIKLPFLTMKETIEHKPEKVVGEVGCPIHITVAMNDSVNPKEESFSLYEKALEPKALLEIPDASHYDVYEGALFEQASQAQLGWLRTYL